MGLKQRLLGALAVGDIPRGVGEIQGRAGFGVVDEKDHGIDVYDLAGREIAILQFSLPGTLLRKSRYRLIKDLVSERLMHDFQSVHADHPFRGRSHHSGARFVDVDDLPVERGETHKFAGVPDHRGKLGQLRLQPLALRYLYSHPAHVSPARGIPEGKAEVPPPGAAAIGIGSLFDDVHGPLRAENGNVALPKPCGHFRRP